eukprot:TRINITY_DN5888_c0_g1_i5.p1 TRINITY_DN5888_c0_g1~~TRINITY_DN5888_c0_g1_i5.p1  ORF type:complete len:233 (-),score=26.64 TRINITY_DN5888_c0_g1_i5:337-996(-)
MARANPTTRTYLLCAQRIPSLQAVPGDVHDLVVRLWLDPFFAVWRPSHLACRFGPNVGQILCFQTRATDRPTVTLWLPEWSNALLFAVEGIVPPTVAFNPSATHPTIIDEPQSPPADIPRWQAQKSVGNWRLIHRGNGLEVRNVCGIGLGKTWSDAERVDLLPDGTLRYVSTRAGVLFVRPTGTEHSPDVTGIDFAWDSSLDRAVRSQAATDTLLRSLA